jgi:hypothetical protein
MILANVMGWIVIGAVVVVVVLVILKKMKDKYY